MVIINSTNRCYLESVANVEIIIHGLNENSNNVFVGENPTVSLVPTEKNQCLNGHKIESVTEKYAMSMLNIFDEYLIRALLVR